MKIEPRRVRRQQRTERFLRFSIRKFAVGTASVTIATGMMFLGGTSVAADDAIQAESVVADTAVVGPTISATDLVESPSQMNDTEQIGTVAQTEDLATTTTSTDATTLESGAAEAILPESSVAVGLDEEASEDTVTDTALEATSTSTAISTSEIAPSQSPSVLTTHDWGLVQINELSDGSFVTADGQSGELVSTGDVVTYFEVAAEGSQHWTRYAYNTVTGEATKDFFRDMKQRYADPSEELPLEPVKYDEITGTFIPAPTPSPEELEERSLNVVYTDPTGRVFKGYKDDTVSLSHGLTGQLAGISDYYYEIDVVDPSQTEPYRVKISNQGWHVTEYADGTAVWSTGLTGTYTRDEKGKTSYQINQTPSDSKGVHVVKVHEWPDFKIYELSDGTSLTNTGMSGRLSSDKTVFSADRIIGNAVTWGKSYSYEGEGSETTATITLTDTAEDDAGVPLVPITVTREDEEPTTAPASPDDSTVTVKKFTDENYHWIRTVTNPVTGEVTTDFFRDMNQRYHVIETVAPSYVDENGVIIAPPTPSPEELEERSLNVVYTDPTGRVFKGYKDGTVSLSHGLSGQLAGISDYYYEINVVDPSQTEPYRIKISNQGWHVIEYADGTAVWSTGLTGTYTRDEKGKTSYQINQTSSDSQGVQVVGVHEWPAFKIYELSDGTSLTNTGMSGRLSSDKTVFSADRIIGDLESWSAVYYNDGTAIIPTSDDSGGSEGIEGLTPVSVTLDGIKPDTLNVDQSNSGDTPAIESPVTEAPAADTPAVEVPVSETPVVETPISEQPAPAVESPVSEVPVVDTPVSEQPAPVVETPVTDTPADTPAVESSVTEVPVVETPISEQPAPVVETPVAETPVDTPAVEAPVSEVPVVETPISEQPAPVVETPVTDTPVDTPVVEVPVSEVPVVETPISEQPAPVVEIPVTDTPADTPAVESPVTEVPVVEVPVSEQPAPVVETPVAETPADTPADTPAVESPVSEVPVVETPISEQPAPVVETPVAETPADTPAVESPVSEVPVVETPVSEQPAPTVETPVAEAPVDTPAVESPVSEVPVVETPISEQPAPAVETPVAETPVDTPAVESPVTEVPVVEAPVSEQPAPVVETPVDTPTVDTPVAETKIDKPTPLPVVQVVVLGEIPSAVKSISNVDAMPIMTRYAYKYAVDTSSPGEKEAVVVVTYADLSTKEVSTLIQVVDNRTEAEKYSLEIQAVQVAVNEMPNALAAIANSDKLPAATTIVWSTKVDTQTIGNKVATILVTYPDKSTASHLVPIKVIEAKQIKEQVPNVDKTLSTSLDSASGLVQPVTSKALAQKEPVKASQTVTPVTSNSQIAISHSSQVKGQATLPNTGEVTSVLPLISSVGLMLAGLGFVQKKDEEK